MLKKLSEALNKKEPAPLDNFITIDGKSLRVEEHFHVLGLEGDQKKENVLVVVIADHGMKKASFKNSIGLVITSHAHALELANLIVAAADDIFSAPGEVRH